MGYTTTSLARPENKESKLLGDAIYAAGFVALSAGERQYENGESRMTTISSTNAAVPEITFESYHDKLHDTTTGAPVGEGLVARFHGEAGLLVRGTINGRPVNNMPAFTARINNAMALTA